MMIPPTVIPADQVGLRQRGWYRDQARRRRRVSAGHAVRVRLPGQESRSRRPRPCRRAGPRVLRRNLPKRTTQAPRTRCRAMRPSSTPPASSQPCRTMHDVLLLGFNTDESGKKVVDGVVNWIGGATGVFLNYPLRAALPHASPAHRAATIPNSRDRSPIR